MNFFFIITGNVIGTFLTGGTVINHLIKDKMQRVVSHTFWGSCNGRPQLLSLSLVEICPAAHAPEPLLTLSLSFFVSGISESAGAKRTRDWLEIILKIESWVRVSNAEPGPKISQGG